MQTEKFQVSGFEILLISHEKTVVFLANMLLVFSARCNIYISCLCLDASSSVRLSVHQSVMEVHWRIIANLGLI